MQRWGLSAAIVFWLAFLGGGIPMMITEVSAIELDDLDDLDRQDVEDYIENARKAADRENFSDADEYVEKAAKYGIEKAEFEKARQYISKKRQERDARLAAERKAEEERRAAAAAAAAARARTSSSSTSGTALGPNSGTILVRFEDGGNFFSLEIDEYTITIQRTADLGGNTVYDYPLKDTGGTGFFTGGTANFFSIPFGYYRVEAIGLDDGRKVYGTAWSNIRLDCGQLSLTLYGKDRSPSFYCW